MKTASLCLLGVMASMQFAAGQTVDLYPTATLMDYPRIGVPFTIQVDIVSGDLGNPTAAPNTIMTDVLPPQFTVLSYSVANWERMIGDWWYWPYDPAMNATLSITNYGNTIQCNAGILQGTYYRRVWITVVANVVGTFNNAIAVSSPVTDSAPSNNSLNQTIQVHSNSLFVRGGQSIPEQSGSNAVFVVELSPPSTATVSVDYHTLDGTATAGQDYQPVSGTLEFPPGVTNRTVSVPVLDDALEEADSQSFTLQLTNAVNAEISNVAEPDYVLDDEPPLQMSIINDNPVVWEGDTGSTNLVYPVQLSGPADVPVLVDYTIGPNPTNYGTLAFPAGTTNQSLTVTVPGNVSVETDRVFQVTLSYPRGTPDISLVQATAQGTILDDDMLPGKFHSMTINSVPSPQIAGRPFPVTVVVKDYYDDPATNFHDAVRVVLYAHSNYNSRIVYSVDVTNFSQGVGTVLMTSTNANTNAMLVAWKFWGSGFSAASTPSFKVIPPPTLFLSLPASAAEGDGVLASAGLVSITNIDSQDVTVRLASTDTQEVIVPPSVMIPAGQTSAVFDVTIMDDTRLDGTHTTWVTADADYYVSASAGTSVRDNESAELTVTLPASLMEGVSGNYGSVTASRVVDGAILVNFTSSDMNQLFVTWGVYIQAGQTSATFYVRAPDNKLIDGPRSVTVTARVANWPDATASAIVQDNDTNLTVYVTDLGNNIGVVEGRGTVTNGLRVRLPGISTSNIVVTLSSSDTTEAVVPASVVVPAGQTDVFVDLTLPDDNEFDGNQTVTITASAPGLASGTRTFTVYEDDVHHITFGTIGASQTGGAPISVSFSLRDATNGPMMYYPGTISLGAIGAGNGAAVAPLVVSNLLRGSWHGTVTIKGWGTNVQLVATATNGASGLSAPFNLAVPSWTANLQIKPARLEGNDLRVFFDTIAGYHYRVEVATDLTALSWWPVGPLIVGTGNEMSALDPAVAVEPARYYRLSVVP